MTTSALLEAPARPAAPASLPFGPSEPEQLSSLEILRRARHLVARPGGWCQGWMQKADGSVCIVGALGLSAGPMGGNLLYDAAALLNRHLGFEGDMLALWNDRPGRAQEEVVALFDAVIADVEAAR